jgi:hypothetical protein
LFQGRRKAVSGSLIICPEYQIIAFFKCDNKLIIESIFSLKVEVLRLPDESMNRLSYVQLINSKDNTAIIFLYLS